MKFMFTSLDTSSPIVHGLKGIRYKEDNEGLDEKQSIDDSFFGSCTCCLC